MPLFLPSECWLVTVETEEDGYDELANEWEEWCWNLFDEGPDMVLGLAAPMDEIRARPEYVSDRKCWVFTTSDLHGTDATFLHQYPGLRRASVCAGSSAIALDRESALRALGLTYLPVHLLLEVRDREGGDLRRLAEAALDGDEASFPVLSDALTDAGHPLAASARFVCADLLGVRAMGGMDSFPFKEHPRTLGLLADGDTVLVGASTGDAWLLSLRDGTRERLGKMAPALSADGRSAILAEGGRLSCFHPQPWKERWSIPLPPQHHVAISPNGTLVGGYGEGGIFRLWDGATGRELASQPVPEVRLLGLTDAGWAMSDVRGVRFGLFREGGMEWRDWAWDGGAFAACVSPDARLIACIPDTNVGKLLLLDAVTGAEVASAHAGWMHRPIAFSSNGARLFTCDGRELRGWDARTCRAISSVRCRKGFDTLALSPDGTRVVVHFDETLRVYDLVEETVPVVVDAGAPLTGVSISPDGGRVVGVSPLSDRTLEHGPEGVALPTSGLPAPAASSMSIDEPWTWSACQIDEATMALGGWGEVRIIDVATRDILRRLPAGHGEVAALAWHASTRLLAAACWDGKMRMWTL